METLERHCIAIDTWSVLVPSETTFLLSHLHTDHASMPKRFRYPVYASVVTGALLLGADRHAMLQPVLEPGRWYRTHHHHIPFRVCSTLHTLESIGFYFPTLCVLYMGDCTRSIIPAVERPLSIIYDGLYEQVAYPLPTIEHACTTIKKTLSTRCPVLQLVHHGILSFISTHCHMRFRLHASVSRLVERAATHLDIIDPSSPYLLVGRTYEEDAGDRIVPSSFWFMRKGTPVDPFVPHVDGPKIRVFCTLHATATDIAGWRTTNPHAHFEPLVTRPM